ncbi:MAG: trypsin-like serine protease [Burkholderiaceae bacterium]
MFPFARPSSLLLSRLARRWAQPAALAAAMLPLGAGAQPVPLAHDSHDYSFRTAPGLQARQAGVAASHDVRVEGADWLRLQFSQVKLPAGVSLRLTSLQDGAQQHLNAKTLAQWQNTSAYFNGPALRVELLAARAGRVGEFGIAKVLAGKSQEKGESQCGATDDRVASDVPDRARLLDIGCTANLMAKGCFITAGHCLSSPSLVDVVEFNVPLSNPDGSLVHPAPKDQYAPTAVRKFKDGGIGNDWGVFTVFPNSETGLTPLQAQGKGLKLAKTVPAVGDEVRIHGYGVDTGAANQTQQLSVGPVDSVDTGTTTLRYRADTEGGNSGSAVLAGGRVVAIHTHAGCTAKGGANQGTLFTHPDFQKGFKSVCKGAG